MKAKQFFFVMLGFILLSILGIVGAFYWGENKLKAEGQKISMLLAERDVSQEKIIALSKSKESAEDTEDLEKLIAILLPKEKEQESLVTDIIYTATAEAGISANNISSFSFGDAGDPDSLSGTEKSDTVSGVYVYPFTLQIESISYSTLLQFLQEIETNGRIVQVADIQITPDKATPGLLSAVSLSLKAYVKP